jgi:hypothetical protein
MPIVFDVDEVEGLVAVRAYGTVVADDVLDLIESQRTSARFHQVTNRVIDTRGSLPGGLNLSAIRRVADALKAFYAERNGVGCPTAVIVEGALQQGIVRTIVAFSGESSTLSVVPSLPEACTLLGVAQPAVERLFTRVNSALVSA